MRSDFSKSKTRGCLAAASRARWTATIVPLNPPPTIAITGPASAADDVDRRSFAGLSAALSKVDDQGLVAFVEERIVIGQRCQVELEVIPRRRRRRIDMQRDQVLARRFQIGHLVDRFVATPRHAAGRVRPGALGNQLATWAEDITGLGRAALHDPDDARRTQVVVDRAPLAALPAEDECLVVRAAADGDATVVPIGEDQRAGQVRSLQFQALE